jgi:cell division protein FtsN
MNVISSPAITDSTNNYLKTGFPRMTKYSKKQKGGTLLGIIIGLIIGLAIALGVALVIKNSALPFSNKIVRPEKTTEPAPNQVTDPNKPMYGNKDSTKEAAKDFAKKADEKATAGAIDEKADPKAAKAAADKAAADKAAADKTAKTADNPDEKFTYFLQAGAFREQADAENARAKLALLGFSALITERESDNGMLYRVRVGPFSQTETMNRVRSKLSDSGVDVAVVRVPK